MSINQRQNVAYGLSQPLIPEAPIPVKSRRSPAATDYAAPGTIWTNILTNQVYILASIVANVATWVSVAGGAGTFASLTVTPGPVSLTGTTSINTVGAATTSIGVGGTGLVSIGNATGNVVIPAGSLTLTVGSVTLTAGNLNLTLGDLNIAGNRAINFTGNLSIVSGAGDPNAILLGTQGSLYLRTDGTGINDRLFVNTDGLSAWAGIVTTA